MIWFVMKRPDVAQVARDLIRECIAVGRAEGALLDDGLVEEIVRSILCFFQLDPYLVHQRLGAKLPRSIGHLFGKHGSMGSSYCSY